MQKIILGRPVKQIRIRKLKRNKLVNRGGGGIAPVLLHAEEN